MTTTTTDLDAAISHALDQLHGWEDAAASRAVYNRLASSPAFSHFSAGDLAHHVTTAMLARVSS
jgi:hypothetical protein